MLKDTSEYRHYMTLKRAYIGVKLANERAISNQLPASESASAKTYQAIKCKTFFSLPKYCQMVVNQFIAGVMMLKRKLKRIREGRGAEPEDDAEDC